MRDGAARVRVVADPSDALLQDLSATDPANPMWTPQYAAAQRALGGRLLLAAEFDGERLTAGVLGVAHGRSWRRWLEIPSLPPALRDGDALWAALRAAARRLNVWEIDAGSFCSRGAPLPEWAASAGTLRERTEWVLDLSRPAWLESVSSNHRRNAAKARRAGIEVVRSGEPAAAAAHTGLMAASMRRRDERGEAVPEIDAAETRATAALLAAGVAECWQARRGDEVLSSLLVMRAPAGAYYQSAGTSPEGMALGASSLVVLEAAQRLQADGVARFSLGGAGAESAGLLRFKSGFGASPVALRAARYAIAPAVLRKGWTAARLLARDRRTLVRMLASLESFEVYTAEAARLPRHDADAFSSFRRLDDDALETLARDQPEFADHAARRRRLGYNAAYAADVDGRVANVSWLVDAEQDRRSARRDLALRPGEGEITHAYTAREFRGRGVYPNAIRALAHVAPERGIRRILMMTSVHNVASQRGIVHAGLAPCGRLHRVFLAGGRLSFVVRRFRRDAGVEAGVDTPPGGA